MPGIIDLALNRPTSQSSYVMPFAASRAVDGSLATTSRWLTNKLPAWMKVDLGDICLVNNCVVTHMGSIQGWTKEYNVLDYTLCVSTDDKNWKEVSTVKNNTESINRLSFTPEVARYVAVVVSKGVKINPNLTSIVDLNVYGIPYKPYLSSLVLTSGTLTPAFTNEMLSYTAKVGLETSSIKVIPTAGRRTVDIFINGLKCNNAQASGDINLVVGENTINVILMEFWKTNSYIIKVTRAVSADLSALSISSCDLIPNFAGKTIFAYTANVENSVKSITVRPTAEDSSAKITVNGTNVISGNTSGEIPLNVGTNTIKVAVVASDNSSTQTYMLTINRVGLNTLDTGSLLLDQTFAPDNLIYTASVGYDTESITVSPTTNINGAVITVDDITIDKMQQSVTVKLSPGVDNIVTITVMSGSVEEKYTITVKKSSNTLLKNLTSNKPVTPPLPPPPAVKFNPTQYKYTGNVANSVTSIQLTPALQDTNAKITVDGTVVNASGVVSNLFVTISGVNYVVGLSSGTNTININVTPVFGSEKGVYTLTILKPY